MGIPSKSKKKTKAFFVISVKSCTLGGCIFLDFQLFYWQNFPGKDNTYLREFSFRTVFETEYLFETNPKCVAIIVGSVHTTGSNEYHKENLGRTPDFCFILWLGFTCSVLTIFFNVFGHNIRFKMHFKDWACWAYEVPGKFLS